MTVLIAGCGIAGPALGAALARAGIGSHVIEAHAAGEAQAGAFLALAPNGINALRAVGLGDVVAEAGGVPVPDMRFLNARGREIGRLDGGDFARTYGADTHLVRRGALHEQLRDAARAAGVATTFGARITGITEGPGSVSAHLDTGETVEGEVLLGCDGVHSTVRRLAFPDAPVPRYTGVLDCGAWTPVDLPDTRGQRMVWGRRAFFGYVVHDRTAYWFSNVPRGDEPARGEPATLDAGAWIRTLRALHADDPYPVPQILAAADAALGVWPVYDLGPLPTWHTDRVCLLGDAAHAAS
ncbi:MAG TPA: NAD(P)/FAD-dependent oxidoreductase, partial [Pseudonocardia sp.]|nr:NAD(P)/FAD-dependent oxidoreductase [Pseudonocardia sp.]